MEEPHLGHVEWAFATGVVEENCILALCVFVSLVVVCGLGKVQRRVADGCGGWCWRGKVGLIFGWCQRAKACTVR
jgi:hypothetical protein